MPILDEILAANEAYAATFGDKAQLALPPARGFAVLTCMDARLDPAKYAGLAEGDAHVIRNAGGRASDDAIRSLVISYKLLGTKEWFVIHHTNCGMEFFTDEVMRDLLASSLETAALGADGFTDVGTGPGSAEAKYIDWLTISDNAQSVVEDVARIRSHPLVPGIDPDPRLHLRRLHRSPCRGAISHGSRPAELAASGVRWDHLHCPTADHNTTRLEPGPDLRGAPRRRGTVTHGV